MYDTHLRERRLDTKNRHNGGESKAHERVIVSDSFRYSTDCLAAR